VIHNEPWESVSMDFMTQLPEWNGMDIILIVIDRLCKLAKMVPTNIIITTSIQQNCSLTCGLNTMKFIISDKNAKFTMGF
jgi:hypothetical protein